MKKRIIIWIIGWIIIYIVFFKMLPSLTDKYHGCYIHKDVYKQSIQSMILKKFIDSTNHGEETIVFFSGGKNEEKMIFTPEFNGMYDFINIGDSIIKKKGSIYYKIVNGKTGKDTLFKFYTTCADSIKSSNMNR